jgi:hypothetical protein
MTQSVGVGRRFWTIAPEAAAHQAYDILHFVFIVVPILAGVDKFLNLLVHWANYLAPVIPRMTHIPPHAFMMGVGVIEIIAGLIVAFRPRVGSLIVGVWLAAIVINLLLGHHFYDIALSDFGLCLSAFALFRLSYMYARPARL